MKARHGNELCPLYGAEVLFGEHDECTLCGATENATSIICFKCEEAGKRRCSFPIDVRYKENICAHVALKH